MKDSRDLFRESFYSGCSNYIVLALMTHTTVCVSIFDHFNCSKPFHVGGGRTKRVLAQDFENSCDSPAYKAIDGYMNLMFYVHVVGFPAAALLLLGWNRHANRGLTPAELAEKDGALVALTRRYAPQSGDRAEI